MNSFIKKSIVGIVCLQFLLLTLGFTFTGQRSFSVIDKPSAEVAEEGSEESMVINSSMEEDLSSDTDDFASDMEAVPLTYFPEPAEDSELIEEIEENPVEIVEYKIKSGDTLTRIWEAHGANATGGIAANKAFDDCGVQNSILRAGDLIELQVSSEGEITGLKKDMGLGKVVYLEQDQGEYKARLVEPTYVDRERRVYGSIENSFFEAARKQDVPFEVIDKMVDVMSARMEFRRDIHPGDSFSLIFNEKVTSDGQHVVASSLKGASLTSSGKLRVAVHHRDKNGKEHYYDQEGKPIGNYFLRYPVKFSRISSVFNKSRFHPVLKRRRPHNGVDFAAPTGTPVRAVADGRITMAGYKGGGGKTVKIKHTSRYSTAYLHLSKISSGIRPGTTVKRGQIIGKVGSTGLATGPHLHFSFYDNGRYVDPLKIELPQVPEKYEAIPVKYLKEMLRQLKVDLAEDPVRYAKVTTEAVSSIG